MKNCSRINSDKVIIYTVIGVALILAVIFTVQMITDRMANQAIKEEFLEGPYSSEECDRLTPEYASFKYYNKIRKYPSLDFSQKKLISPRGYGFKKKVVFDKKTVFQMEFLIEADMYNKGFVYGIYRDELLQNPVRENYTQEEFDEEIADEKGKPYEPYEYGIEVIVEPGTYYIAGFATDKEYSSKVHFHTSYGYICDEYDIEFNRTYRYFKHYTGGDTYFKFAANKNSKIKVTASGDYIVLCDADKNEISERVYAVDAGETTKILTEFEVNNGKTYYIKAYNEKCSCLPYEILYPRIMNVKS